MGSAGEIMSGPRKHTIVRRGTGWLWTTCVRTGPGVQATNSRCHFAVDPGGLPSTCDEAWEPPYPPTGRQRSAVLCRKTRPATNGGCRARSTPTSAASGQRSVIKKSRSGFSGPPLARPGVDLAAASGRSGPTAPQPFVAAENWVAVLLPPRGHRPQSVPIKPALFTSDLCTFIKKLGWTIITF